MNVHLNDVNDADVYREHYSDLYHGFRSSSQLVLLLERRCRAVGDEKGDLANCLRRIDCLIEDAQSYISSHSEPHPPVATLAAAIFIPDDELHDDSR